MALSEARVSKIWAFCPFQVTSGRLCSVFCGFDWTGWSAGCTDSVLCTPCLSCGESEATCGVVVDAAVGHACVGDVSQVRFLIGRTYYDGWDGQQMITGCVSVGT